MTSGPAHTAAVVGKKAYLKSKQHQTVNKSSLNNSQVCLAEGISYTGSHLV